jgi:hypothetical protein
VRRSAFGFRVNSVIGRWAFDVFCLFRKSFLAHEVWHLRRVAAVIVFEHVNQSLDSASGRSYGFRSSIALPDSISTGTET